MVSSILLYVFQICLCILVNSIKKQVKLEIFPRYWPYKGDLNFSKDWSDECDVPCGGVVMLIKRTEYFIL